MFAKWNTRKIAWILLLLIWTVAGMKNLKEPDFWWQLRTGQWMVENKAVTFTDMFSYTYPGVNWINVKWMYEAFIGALSYTMPPEMITLLQVIANLCIIMLLFRCYRIAKQCEQTTQPTPLSAGFWTMALVVLFVSLDRLNARPEMTSHVLLLVYLCLYLKARQTANPKWFYWFIPIQVYWANMHEAFGIGYVLMLVMTAGYWFDHFFLKNRSRREAIHITLCTLAAIACVAINPRGVSLIAHPYEIFRQVQTNTYTSESFPYTEPEYWQPEAYVNILFSAMAFVALWALGFSKKKWLLSAARPLGTAYPVLLVLFFYLSLNAFRNILFAQFLALPILALSMDGLLNKVKQKIKKAALRKKLQTALGIGILVSGVAVYVLLVSDTYYKWSEKRANYGLVVNNDANPVRVAAYVQQKHVQGRCFSDYLTSSYLLWALQPGFKTYIDLRDMDVFPQSFFTNFSYMLYDPSRFDTADAKYHFDYAIVYRPQFQALHNYLMHHTNWVVAYADPVAVLYLKKNGANARLAASFTEKNADIFMHPDVPLQEPPATAVLISKLFNPFWSEQKRVRQTDYDLVAAEYYMMNGNYKTALQRAELSVKNGYKPSEGLIRKGNIFLQQASADTGAIQAAQISDASQAYTEALRKDKNNSYALLGLALVSALRNDIISAQSFLKKSIEADPKNLQAHRYMVQLLLSQRAQSNTPKLTENLIKHLEVIVAKDATDHQSRFQLGVMYCEVKKCDEGVPLLEENMKLPGISEQDRNYAKQLIENCE